MKRDYNARKASNDKGSRVILYIHGGAYYFGSPDEHRYQITRHVRKLKARALVPRYRLAPQFPFPCGLQDALAAYLQLLEEHDPSTILFMGDSAGGGMILSLLVLLRDQGIRLPAGAILLSPWVDLMHSFPSVAGIHELDYIPSHGFIHKPSASWPPPTLEADEKMPTGVAAVPDSPEHSSSTATREATSQGDESTAEDAEKGYSETPVQDLPPSAAKVKPGLTGHSVPSIMIDGKLIQVRDQIQMYAPNHLLTHPLVSPCLQPSLGGLCPLLIQAGGGEMLRDEQIYIAHKAANPAAYPPSDEVMARYDPDQSQLHKWGPTNVQLQVWEDMCHVAHTFSWTGPANFMYRSCAQFGAWALAKAQKRAIDIEEERGSEDELTDSDDEAMQDPQVVNGGIGAVNREAASTPLVSKASTGRAGDPLPPFRNHMIRQRVDRHGRIYPLAPAPELPALQMSPSEIGVLKEGPVRKWLARQEQWNQKFANEKKRLQKERARDIAQGYIGFGEGEKPPPTALAGRRLENMPKAKKPGKSWGMMMWSSWGSKREREIAQGAATTEVYTAVPAEPNTSQALSTNNDAIVEQPQARSRSRSRVQSFSRTVADEGQADAANGHSKDVLEKPYGSLLTPSDANRPTSPNSITPTGDGMIVGSTLIPPSEASTTRPTHDGIAYPFKLAIPGHMRMKSANPSMMTLDSADASLSEAGDSEVLGPNATSPPNSPLRNAENHKVETGEQKVDPSVVRPQPERFVTAMETL